MAIREATKKDTKFIIQMIRDLAKYEKALDQMMTTEAELIRDGFEANPLFKSLILEHNNLPVGFALYFYKYSTWKGKTLYLEDLYVTPPARGNGLGMSIMKHLAKVAIDESCRRFEWQVLDWNEASIKFYESFHSDLDNGWINCRLENEKISYLASL
jgi:GNAT superfamily N-acetyltransferase